MQRGRWVFLAAFSLVVALLGLVIFLPSGGAGAARNLSDALQVRTYPVPPEQGESIRDAVRHALLVGYEGAQPMGQATLPRPDMLMVSAPATMHPSIEVAIKQLSGEVNTTVDAASPRSHAFDIWVMEVSPGASEDDAALTALKPVLDQAREVFGIGALRVTDRFAMVGSGGIGKPGEAGPISVRSDRLGAIVRILSTTAESVDVDLGLDWMQEPGSFFSRLTLRNNQWQIVGLLGSGGADSPERLLLVRQRPLDATP